MATTLLTLFAVLVAQGPESPFVSVEDPDTFLLALTEDVTLRFEADCEAGFHFPYYLSVPRSVEESDALFLLVEPNNTGSVSDDFEVHDRSARKLASQSYVRQIAAELSLPLLVPVFPRPEMNWKNYTHALDEDTLRIDSDPLKRIDLQLLAMIAHAQEFLWGNGIEVEEKVFLDGFSASGTFCNRFAILHPQAVRAVASGGVNSIPTFPTEQWRGTKLPYPVGIEDLKEITGIEFDEEAYRKVSQFIYMGGDDRNDTTLFRDAFTVEHAELIHETIGKEMPKRWEMSRSIYAELRIPAQMVTYHGVGHTVRPEMGADIVAFFRANSGEEIVAIEPHAGSPEQAKSH